MTDEQLRDRVRALIGPEPTEDQIIAALAPYSGRCAPYRAAADLADLMGRDLIAGSHVTSVEDIAVDARRPVQTWWALADRLRAQAAECAAEDDGPFVVGFHGADWIEAVEHD